MARILKRTRHKHGKAKIMNSIFLTELCSTKMQFIHFDLNNSSCARLYTKLEKKKWSSNKVSSSPRNSFCRNFNDHSFLSCNIMSARNIQKKVKKRLVKLFCIWFQFFLMPTSAEKKIDFRQRNR